MGPHKHRQGQVACLVSCRDSLDNLFSDSLLGSWGTLSGGTEANQQLVSLMPLGSPVNVNLNDPNWSKQIKLLLVSRHERRRMKACKIAEHAIFMGTLGM